MSEIKQRVLDYINRYYKYHNKIPRFSVISNKMDIPKVQVIKIMRELESDGYIKRNYSQYKFNEDREQEILEEQKENKGYLSDKIIIIIVRVVMGLIGIGAVILSMNYLSVWFGEHLSGWVQYLFAGIAVSFNVMSFELIILMWKNRQYGIALLFFFVWSIVFIFSIMAIISGQYNKRTDKIVEKNKENFSESSKNLEYLGYNKDIQDIEDTIKPKKDRLDSLSKMIDEFDLKMKIEKKKEYDDLYSKIQNLEWELSQLNNKLTSARNKMTKFVKDNKVENVSVQDVERQTFYKWIAGILKGSNEAEIEFWMGLLPATFLDVISAMSLAVALFLRKKNNRNKESFIKKIFEFLFKKEKMK